jgi:parallel beta-helix repeat protein
VSISPSTSNLLIKKKGAVTTAFLLMLLFAALPFSVSASAPLGLASNVQTTISVNVQPNPVAIGNTVLFNATVAPPPPTSNDSFSGLTLSITRPDGAIYTRGPFLSDSSGLLYTYYTPDLVGDYKIQVNYPGQFFTNRNITYTAAQSPVTTLSVQPKVGPRTWIVDDDSPADFHTVQEAINAASSGDTVFVRSGTYRENLVVNKPLSLIGENASQTTIIPSTPGKVVTVSASRVTIVGFTIQGSGSTQSSNIGVYFDSPTSFGNVSHNILFGHGYAISLSGSSHNVDCNYVANNGISGIYLNGSSNNVITRNNVTGGKTGIFIAWPSSRNVLRDNNMTGNELNLHVISYDLQGFINDIDTSNTVNGKPVYYWISKTNQVVPRDAGAVALINCANITVQDLEITSTGQGVLLAYTNGTTVQRNNITNCDNAIRVQFSSNNTLNGNYIYASTSGVALVNASSNTISNNTISASLNQAIFVFLSSKNRLYANNLNNRIQAWVDSVAIWNNTWDNGYPSGGNYWSDYNGNDANHDGIGDTPYVIDANNIDRYPLMPSSSKLTGIDVMPEFPSAPFLFLLLTATLFLAIFYKRGIRAGRLRPLGVSNG